VVRSHKDWSSLVFTRKLVVDHMQDPVDPASRGHNEKEEIKSSRIPGGGELDRCE
jgi:hypothetical protein